MEHRMIPALTLVGAAVLAALPAAWADPHGRTPVTVLDQPDSPVRLTEIQPQISLWPAGNTLTTVWFVRGVMTNVVQKQIVEVETAWTLFKAHDEAVGTVKNLNTTRVNPGEHRKAILSVLTDLLYKQGLRVTGMVLRAQFNDGSVWTLPPTERVEVPK